MIPWRSNFDNVVLSCSYLRHCLSSQGNKEWVDKNKCLLQTHLGLDLLEAGHCKSGRQCQHPMISVKKKNHHHKRHKQAQLPCIPKLNFIKLRNLCRISYKENLVHNIIISSKHASSEEDQSMSRYSENHKFVKKFLQRKPNTQRTPTYLVNMPHSEKNKAREEIHKTMNLSEISFRENLIHNTPISYLVNMLHSEKIKAFPHHFECSFTTQDQSTCFLWNPNNLFRFTT